MAKSMIMIIDDDEKHNKMLADVVVTLGYDCFQAFSTEEAKIALIETKIQPSLVICKTQFSNMSGLQFFRETVIKNLNLNVCMMAGHFDRVEMIEALQLGAVDFVMKPIQHSFFLEKMGRLVELGRGKKTVKEAMAENPDYMLAEKKVAELRVQNSLKKPA